MRNARKLDAPVDLYTNNPVSPVRQAIAVTWQRRPCAGSDRTPFVHFSIAVDNCVHQ